MTQDATEHPAYKAAKMIRDLHVENIEKIDSGFVFLKDGVDVSADMRAQCTVQVALCEQIMARAEKMLPQFKEPARLILEEFEAIAKEAAESKDGLAHIPEIGDYGHNA